MEIEETVYRPELLEGAELMPRSRLAPHVQEADELTAIFASLIKNAKQPKGGGSV